MSEYGLQECYVQYLRRVRCLKESSVAHYLDAIRYISEYLVRHGKLRSSVYEINDPDELEIIKAYLEQQADYVALNERGHQMYSAGLNNYIRFVNGEDFFTKRSKIEYIDVKIPIGNYIYASNYKASAIIRRQALELAHYNCEIDNSHQTFIDDKTKHQYMETHHALALSKQNRFDCSLDVYANILCLCPNCHKLLHHGTRNAKIDLLSNIYEKRSDRLAQSGICLSKYEFIEIAL